MAKQTEKATSSDRNQDDRQQQTNLATYAQLAAGMAFFGSGTPTSKLVTDAFPVFLASGLRMVIATAILLPFVFKSGKRAYQSCNDCCLSCGNRRDFISPVCSLSTA